jgi:hypothetical protein
MGMQQTIEFPAGSVPTWEALRDFLGGLGFPIQLWMIDGALAFPDEAPPAGWRELRVGTPQGMITLRREGDRLVLVTWGNADRSLVQAWNALTWACAVVGNGQITSENGAMTADEYRRESDLPEGLRI